MVVRVQRARTRIAARGAMLVASVAGLLWLAWLLRSGNLDRNDAGTGANSRTEG